MISYRGALNIIEKEFKTLKVETEKVSLLDSLGRILAEDIRTDTDQPSFTNSSMDGFAVKYSRKLNKWKIIGEITAGKYQRIKVKTGEAVRIMTGAIMPAGADTVIPKEVIREIGGHAKYLNNIAFYKGMNVRNKGEDVKRGQLLLVRNTILNPNNITAAASCGKSKIKVVQKLKIGVLSTGNELIDIKMKPKKDELRASNLYSILSAIHEMNMVPISFGFVRDDIHELKKHLKASLRSGIDILLTTGGVSAGKYDYMIDIFNQLGVKVKFTGVNIKPGKPLVFGIYNTNRKKVFVYGLPGNPVSCYVNFLLFVRNVIMNMFTLNKKFETIAVVNNIIAKQDNKRNFLRGVIKNIDGINTAYEVGSQSSANIGGLNSANCLIVMKEKQMKLNRGDLAECIMI